MIFYFKPRISLLLLHTCVLVILFNKNGNTCKQTKLDKTICLHNYTQRETVLVPICTRIGNWNSVKGPYVQIGSDHRQHLPIKEGNAAHSATQLGHKQSSTLPQSLRK